MFDARKNTRAPKCKPSAGDMIIKKLEEWYIMQCMYSDVMMYDQSPSIT